MTPPYSSKRQQPDKYQFLILIMQKGVLQINATRPKTM